MLTCASALWPLLKHGVTMALPVSWSMEEQPARPSPSGQRHPARPSPARRHTHSHAHSYTQAHTLTVTHTPTQVCTRTHTHSRCVLSQPSQT